jgi:hypothetical protein
MLQRGIACIAPHDRGPARSVRTDNSGLERVLENGALTWPAANRPACVRDLPNGGPARLRPSERRTGAVRFVRPGSIERTFGNRRPRASEIEHPCVIERVFYPSAEPPCRIRMFCRIARGAHRGERVFEKGRSRGAGVRTDEPGLAHVRHARFVLLQCYMLQARNPSAIRADRAARSAQPRGRSPWPAPAGGHAPTRGHRARHRRAYRPTLAEVCKRGAGASTAI